MSLDLETALSFALTAVACLTAAVVDVRQRRIPNRITFPAMGLLLVLHGLLSGWPGLREAGLGLVGGFLVMLVPHLFGVLGAGDVKLVAAAGAGLGSGALLTLVLFTSIAGGVQYVIWRLWLTASQGRFGRGYRLCYGPAIAAGVLGTMALALAGQPYLTVDFSLFR